MAYDQLAELAGMIQLKQPSEPGVGHSESSVSGVGHNESSEPAVVHKESSEPGVGHAESSEPGGGHKESGEPAAWHKESGDDDDEFLRANIHRTSGLPEKVLCLDQQSNKRRVHHMVNV